MICSKRSLLDLARSVAKFLSEGIGEGTQAVVTNLPGCFLNGSLTVSDQIMSCSEPLVLQILKYRESKHLLKILFQTIGIEAYSSGQF